MSLRDKGFTIVELLIVIAVIGILATVTLVAFNGVQARARDAQRLQDMTSIAKALEIHRLKNGTYPDEVQTPNGQGWEQSADDTNTPTDFLSALRTSGTASKIPVDPKNGGTGGTDPSNSSSRWVYFYHLYGAGASGCPVERGDFYVLGVTRMETIPSGGIHSSSPGFSCSGQNWGGSRGAWVTGDYTNK